VKSRLAVNALFSFLVLVLCLTATVGIPLRHASGWILLTCSCLIFAAIANQKAFRLKFRLKIVLPVVVSAIALAIGVGAKSFQGCFPGITPGTWSYACFGQYLADYARGTDGALPYIDQFSAYFTDTRFGTPSLLGFLSAILHINTARAVFPALLIILANGLLGFCLLSRSLGANKIIALGSGVFFVLERKSFLKLFYENDLYGKRYLLPGLEKERVPTYILSDYPRARSVWNNDVFWLSSVPQELSILSIDSPNGIESKGGKKFLRIGDQPTKFFVLADKERAAVLSSEAVVMGPSIPRSKLRNLCVRSANDIQEFQVGQHFSVSLQLRRGINEVEIWCKDRPEVVKGPNGDTRILLLGLLNYQLESSDMPSSSSKAPDAYHGMVK